MPIVRMPDNKLVRFDDNMSNDEIVAFITENYPDAYNQQDASVNQPNKEDWLDKANKAIRTAGGAIEAWDRGKYLGFGKKVGGVANAVLSYPFDRVIQAISDKKMPSFGDRYNEIVEGANQMYRDFSNEHPVASIGVEAAGLLKGAPAKIERYAVDRMARATANSGKYERAAGKIAGLLGSGAISSVGAGMGNSDDISEYVTSSDVLKDASIGAGANAALGAAGQAAKAIGKSIPKISATATGTSEGIISRAFDAGKRKSQTFLNNMRGKVSQEKIVGMAKQNLKDMIEANQDLYKSNMSKAFADTKKLDTTKITQNIKDIINQETLGGALPLSGDEKAIVEKSIEFIEPALKNRSLQTTRGLDKIRQKIYDITTQPGTNAHRLKKSIENSIKDTISEQRPEYRKALQTYAQNKGEIEEIARTFSLKDNNAIDTAMRKLQSVGRNNVQTSYGYRNNLMDNLDFGGNLQDAIAGQALSSWKPRGTAGVVGGINALSSAVNTVTNPSALPANLAYALGSSPRLTGEAAYHLGALADYLSKMKVGNVNVGSLASREKNK